MGFPFQHQLAVQPGICLRFPAPLPWHVHGCLVCSAFEMSDWQKFLQGQLLLSLLQVFLYRGLPGVFAGIFFIYDRCDRNGEFRAVP